MDRGSEKGVLGADAGTGMPGGGSGATRGRSMWVSSAPSTLELESLRRRFPEVLTVAAEPVMAETAVWASSAVVARSLGRRVSVESLVREFRRWPELRGDVSASYADNGVFVLRFSESGDRERVLLRPWTMAGQARALERWRPWFFPSEEAISSALVWLRLPGLPVEYWATETLREITEKAGVLVSVDESTASRRRLGFARVCIKVDLTKPLRPGILLQGPAGVYWQGFVFECLEGVCLACARFHGQGKCSAAGSSSEGAGFSEANLAQPGEEGAAAVTEAPALGSWVVAVRRWAPSAGGVIPPRRPGKEPAADADHLGRFQGGGGAKEAGWQTPSKVARRGSLRRQQVPRTAAAGVGGYGVLAGNLEDDMAMQEGSGQLGQSASASLTKSTDATPSPETFVFGRESPKGCLDVAKGKLAASKGKKQVSSKGPLAGSSKDKGPVSFKQARSDEGFGPSTGSASRASGAGVSTQGGSRKGRGSAQANSLSTGLVSVPGSAVGIGSLEGSPVGAPSHSPAIIEHARVVQMVESALKGPEVEISPMDASGQDGSHLTRPGGEGGSDPPM